MRKYLNTVFLLVGACFFLDPFSTTNYLDWNNFTKRLANRTITDVDIYEYHNYARLSCFDYHRIRHHNLNNSESKFKYRDQCFIERHPYHLNYKLYYSKHHSLEDKILTYQQASNLTPITINYCFTWLEKAIYLGKCLLGVIILLNVLSLFGSTTTGFASKITQSPGKLYHGDQLTTTLDDVIGLTETKIEIKQYIDYLKDRTRYTKFGIKIPRGLLFLGPPGCGKTLLAKAIAKTAGVNFIQVSGSDFQEMFVGVGAARVKHLFTMAREHKPCILFIDEIDSLGRNRDISSYNSEGNSVLNKLLVEMDGFANNDNILVIAATNRQNILDPALLRSGRFDRKLVFDTPNINERCELYRHYLKGKPVSKKVVDKQLDEISKRSAGLTGSDINTICNQAGVICLRVGQQKITPQHLYEALEEIAVGNIKRERLMSEEERIRVSYHEAGHCLLGYILEGVNCPIQVSIVPRGEAALGYAMTEPDDKKLYLKEELYAKVAVLLGGRAGEIQKFGTISTGASDDLDKATKLCYDMFTKYGFSKSLISYCYRDSNGQKNYSISELHRQKILEHVHKTLDKMQIVANDIISGNNDKFVEIAELLLKKEVITNVEINKILGDLKDSYKLNT